MESRLAASAFILVVAAYLFLGGMGVTDRDNPEPREAAYNLLARGLLAGHLYLDKAAPDVLTSLKDPYDPEANRVAREDPRYRLHDLSYRGGRLYLYFGVAPAVLVFIPWHFLTGGWLPHWGAVVLLCSIGLAMNVALLLSIRRRVFPGAPGWVPPILVLVLGLGSYAPLLAARADIWEVPIAFSYLAVSAALGFLWRCLTLPGKEAGSLACASMAFGLAFLARPTVLPSAAILLLFLLLGNRRREVGAWVAGVLPLAFCGALAALYNADRFGSPFDFGEAWQLAGVYVAHLRTFGASFLGTNLRLYLAQSVSLTRIFPYFHEPALGPLREILPVDHGAVEHISGILLCAPILWAALFVPGFIRRAHPQPALRLLAISAAWVSASSLLLVSFFFGTCSRYQFEFVPALALLASVGVLALEAPLRGAALHVARCVWIPLALASGAFGVLYGIDRCAGDHNDYAVQFLIRGNTRAAGHEIETAQFLSPGNPMSRLLTGVSLSTSGHALDARRELEALVLDFPGDARAHYWLGNVLLGLGLRDQATAEHRLASGLDPTDETIRAMAEKDQAEPSRPR